MGITGEERTKDKGWGGGDGACRIRGIDWKTRSARAKTAMARRPALRARNLLEDVLGDDRIW